MNAQDLLNVAVDFLSLEKYDECNAYYVAMNKLAAQTKDREYDREIARELRTVLAEVKETKELLLKVCYWCWWTFYPGKGTEEACGICVNTRSSPADGSEFLEWFHDALDHMAQAKEKKNGKT